MTMQVLVDVAVGLAIVGLLMWRQLRWRTFAPARAMRLPLALAALGVVDLARLGATRVTTADLVLFVVELLVSVGIGAAMGRLAAFRPAPADPGVLQSRTGPLGAALWLVLVGLRVALDVVASSAGAHLLTATGVILLLIAASRATAALVTRARGPRTAAAGMIVA